MEFGEKSNNVNKLKKFKISGFFKKMSHVSDSPEILTDLKSDSVRFPVYDSNISKVTKIPTAIASPGTLAMHYITSNIDISSVTMPAVFGSYDSNSRLDADSL